MATVDVVVLGAGFSGLRTAEILADRGLDVVVLEARDRVGGRVRNEQVDDDTIVEGGGTWIGPTQTEMYALVDRLGLERFATHNTGENVLLLGGRATRFPSGRGALPKVSPFALADLAQATLRFGRLAERVPLDAPWTAPDAVTWDGQTFESWIRRNLRTTAGRAYFRIAVEAVFSVTSAELSLLHMLFYARSGTDLDTLLATDAGAQEQRIVGGSVRVAEELARRLGDRVVLGAVARSVAHGADGVTVTTADGRTFGGHAAVVTLPPTLAGRLVYDPPLPSARDQLTQRMPAGAVIKCFAVYDRPFWRDAGLTGQAVSDAGPVKVTFDASPPSGTPGILLGFVEADDARRLARVDPGTRRDAVLRRFADYFGPEARTPRRFLERDWMAEEFTRGCYGAAFTPGVWSAYGHALREPVGRLFWAGAETSDVWNGYMEGAIRSAGRVADEVTAALA